MEKQSRDKSYHPFPTQLVRVSRPVVPGRCLTWEEILETYPKDKSEEVQLP